MRKQPVNWFIVYTAIDGEPLALDPAFEGQEYALQMSEEYGLEQDMKIDVLRVSQEVADELRQLEWDQRRARMIEILS